MGRGCIFKSDLQKEIWNLESKASVFFYSTLYIYIFIPIVYFLYHMYISTYTYIYIYNTTNFKGEILTILTTGLKAEFYNDF